MPLGDTSRIYFKICDLHHMSNCHLTSRRELTYKFTMPTSSIRIVHRSLVKPPSRKNGELWFRDLNSIDSLISALNLDIGLPPIAVKSLSPGSTYGYKVNDGFHRYYLSLAFNFSHLPVAIDDWDFEV